MKFFLFRQTQWDIPTWDEEDDDLYDDEGGGSNTPTYDEKGRQKTTTALADTSSEAAKRLKEAFRSKVNNICSGLYSRFKYLAAIKSVQNETQKICIANVVKLVEVFGK